MSQTENAPHPGRVFLSAIDGGHAAPLIVARPLAVIFRYSG
jgi:hypothetical protein